MLFENEEERKKSSVRRQPAGDFEQGGDCEDAGKITTLLLLDLEESGDRICIQRQMFIMQQKNVIGSKCCTTIPEATAVLRKNKMTTGCNQLNKYIR